MREKGKCILYLCVKGIEWIKESKYLKRTMRGVTP